METVFSKRARSDLIAVGEYIAVQDRTAALRLVHTIVDLLVAQLSDHPKSGKPGRVEGTRELVVHQSYVAVYRVRKNSVEILTVRHTARRWPGSFEVV